MSFTATERLLRPPEGAQPGSLWTSLRTLVWQGESLVDWVGYAVYHLNGSHAERPGYAFRYKFDAATISPSGEFVAIYEQQGTKALLLRHGKLVRELNRSYYHASSYKYPIAFIRLPSGKELIAHCPDEYCRLELDDAATGQRLTQSDARKPSDYLFSRLMSSPSGSYLVSAGWVWHPFDVVKAFDVGEALRDSCHLDGAGIELPLEGETGPACFASDDNLILKDSFDNDATPAVEQSHLRSFDLRTRALRTDVLPPHPISELMAVGTDHVINFHTHPRLMNLHTGAVEQEWPHLNTGINTSSISGGSGANARPILALDPANLRFAVVGESAIHVVELKPK